MREQGKLVVRMLGTTIEATGARPVLILTRTVSFLLVTRALVAVAALAAAHSWLGH
jgi:hypothetical protein